MRTCIKIITTLFIMILLLLSSCSKPTEATDKDKQFDGSTGSSTEEILKDYAENIKADLSTSDISEIESYANQFPLQAASGLQPVVVEQNNSKGTDLLPVIQQRDWAYAYLGLQYTLVGIFVENQEDFLDKAFWCFLVAASLNPDEPEHLCNVAFYLNGKGKYNDAITVLETAKSLLNEGSVNVAVSNNLAYAYAAIHDTTTALIELNPALALWPNNEFFNEKYLLYTQNMQGSNGNNYSSVFGMGCEQLDNIDLYPPELNFSQLSIAGSLFYLKLDSLFREYFTLYTQIPVQNCAGSLDDVMDLWTQISNLRQIRTNCYELTENKEICEKCDKPYENSMHDLAVTYSNQVMASNLNYQARALTLSDEYRKKILNFIKDESSISENDKTEYTKYYKEYFLYQAASIWQISMSNICYARELEVMYRPQLECFNYGTPEIIWPLGGNISVWIGAGSMAVDANKGEVEFQFGQGLQGSIAWNWITETPTVGIGLGFNLDSVIQPGIFIRYTPGKGFDITLDINPATNFVLPGISAPQIPIAELGCFMN